MRHSSCFKDFTVLQRDKRSARLSEYNTLNVKDKKNELLCNGNSEVRELFSCPFLCAWNPIWNWSMYFVVLCSHFFLCRNLNLMGFNLYSLVIWDYIESGTKDTVNLYLHIITILKKKTLELNKFICLSCNSPEVAGLSRGDRFIRQDNPRFLFSCTSSFLSFWIITLLKMIF